VSITKARFRDFVSRIIEVRINTSVRLNAQLTLGVRAETIEVTAPAAVLQRDRADMHQDVTSMNWSIARSPLARIRDCSP